MDHREWEELIEHGMAEISCEKLFACSFCFTAALGFTEISKTIGTRTRSDLRYTHVHKDTVSSLHDHSSSRFILNSPLIRKHYSKYTQINCCLLSALSAGWLILKGFFFSKANLNCGKDFCRNAWTSSTLNTVSTKHVLHLMWSFHLERWLLSELHYKTNF